MQNIKNTLNIITGANKVQISLGEKLKVVSIIAPAPLMTYFLSVCLGAEKLAAAFWALFALYLSMMVALIFLRNRMIETKKNGGSQWK